MCNVSINIFSRVRKVQIPRKVSDLHKKTIRLFSAFDNIMVMPSDIPE
jgi:hypothetical protein